MTSKRGKPILSFGTIAFWFLLCVFVCQVSARSVFDSWTIDNGLPQNSVYSILQTRDGYLWFTTLNGLVRYDGANFTVFDKSDYPGINSNRFTILYEDKEGVLWIGTEENGLTRYKNGVFTSYTTELDPLFNKIFAIQGESDGSLWLLTEGGLARWQDEVLTPYSSEGHLRLDTGTGSKVLLKNIQRNGGIAFADSAGLHVIRDGHLTTLTTADGLSSLKINSLYKDDRGDLWIGTEDAGLNRLHDGKFTVYTMKDGLPSNNMLITAVCQDHRGNLWFAKGSGLYRLKEGILTHYDSADGLSGHLVQNIFEDREGSLWIGTADGGINRFRDEVIKTYSEKDGLSANNIYPIYQDTAGSVWIGAWSNGLNKYEDGKFTHYTKSDGLSSNIVTAIQEDRDGNLWIGTYSGGVNRFKDGQFTTLKGLNGEEVSGILAIYQDRAGTIWFGTTGGLFKYENGVLRHFTTNDGLPHPQVIAIHEDLEGNLWLGTRDGLARLKDDTFTVYKEKDGLSSNHVRSFYEDQAGILWIGTYDGGLNRFKDGAFTRYTKREGLFDNGVFQILNDGRGNFWMSSNRGIYRANRQELEDFAAGKIQSITSIGYGRGDGMLNAECNGGSQPAGIKTRDGQLWFPTQEGIAVIDPAAIQSNPLPPPVLIEAFTIDNQRVISENDQVMLAPGQERLEINYTGLSFIKPEQVRFKYKLEGLDKDWVDAGTQRTAKYSYIPPGNYVFRVIAANSDGVWNTQGAAMRIVVEPPFWKTWWFALLTAAAFIVLLFMAFKFRFAQLKNAQTAQENFSRQLLDSQERERQRIAAELHDGLGQSLLIIKNRAFLALSQMEDRETAEEQLDEISSSVSHAIDEVREITYNLRPYQLERFGLTKTLQAILMQASRACAINFTSEIEAIDNLFSNQAETSIYRIVQEAVNNVIKHSQATEANLMIRTEGNKMILRIQDNGRGIAPVKIPDGAPGRGGFGLVGMSERVRMLGGSFSIESEPGQGTVINIKLTVSGDKREK